MVNLGFLQKKISIKKKNSEKPFFRSFGGAIETFIEEPRYMVFT